MSSRRSPSPLPSSPSLSLTPSLPSPTLLEVSGTMKLLQAGSLLLLLADRTFATCDAIAEIQAVLVSGATGGTFSLTYDTSTHCHHPCEVSAVSTTTPLSAAASASDVREALGALSNIHDAHSIQVSLNTASTAGALKYSITFVGEDVGGDIPLLLVASIDLEPTGSAHISATTVEDGWEGTDHGDVEAEGSHHLRRRLCGGGGPRPTRRPTHFPTTFPTAFPSLSPSASSSKSPTFALFCWSKRSSVVCSVASAVSGS